MNTTLVAERIAPARPEIFEVQPTEEEPLSSEVTVLSKYERFHRSGIVDVIVRYSDGIELAYQRDLNA